MNKTSEPTVVLASPDSVFSLAARFASRVNSLGLPQARINELNNGDDSFWTAIDAALMPIVLASEYSSILRD